MVPSSAGRGQDGTAGLGTTLSRVAAVRSKREVVYDALLSAIVRGELRPGSRLVIDEIAPQLGVSPIPVREALQRLQADGFVVLEPYVGATVAQLHAGSIAEVFALLESLEVISGRAACQRMGKPALGELETLLRGMDTAVGDLDRFSEENAHLHLFLCDQAAMPLVGSLTRQALTHWDRLRRHYLNEVFARRVAVSQREHWQLLAALRTRDPDRVERIVRAHNLAAREAYEEHLRETGRLVPPEPVPVTADERRLTARGCGPQRNPSAGRRTVDGVSGGKERPSAGERAAARRRGHEVGTRSVLGTRRYGS